MSVVCYVCGKGEIKMDLKIGDKVKVNDPGLLMLMTFAPKGAKPINVGFITAIRKDGYAEIEFPIGDDPIEEHSQASMYPLKMLTKI